MIDALRKEVRRLSGVRLDSAFLVALLENVIIKRELIDGEQGDDALAYVKKLSALSKGRGPCQMPKPHPAQIKFD
jgi:hypothetical protein